MMNNNKILTVSYGTFSCTLEGFEDSFGTMKAIAEYFRDLAADDRYFGAEPPQPDAEMLARIAEKEVARRVEARQQDGQIVLSAIPAEAATETPAQPIVSLVPETAKPAEEAPAEPEMEVEADAGAEENAPLLQTVSSFPAEVQTADSVQEDSDAHAEAEELLAEEEDDDAAMIAAIGSITEPAEIVETTEAELVDIVPGQPDAEVEAFFDGDADTVDADVAEVDEDAADFVEDDAEVAEIDEDDMDDVAIHGDEAEVAFEQEAAFEDDDADEATPLHDLADIADEDEAPAETAPLHAMEEVAFEAEEVEVTQAPADNSIAAKLQRIRAVVSRRTVPQEETFLEDEHAETEETGSDTSDLIAEARADIEDALQVDDAADAASISDPEDEEEDALSALLSRVNADSASDVADHALAQTDAAEDEEDTLEADEAEDAVAVAEDDIADSVSNLFEDDAEKDVAPAMEQPKARVIKVKRADLEAAIEQGDLEEVAEDEDHAISALDALAPSKQPETALSAEEEEDLARELTDLKADIEAERDEAPEADMDEVAEVEEAEESVEAARPSGRSRLPALDDEDNGDVERLLTETDHQMDEPESATRRDAFAHLRAAVAAKKADTTIDDDAASGKGFGVYREDLAEVVRPRRPVSTEARTERPEESRPAPLKLVAEQRIDVEQPASRGPVRPRRVAAPVDVQATDASEGFTEFAEEMGATTLPELLEAAAAYLSFVEGREQFSRPQLMTKVRQAGGQDGFSREEGLRHFGQLLRKGKIEKIKGGRFTVSDDIGFRPDERAAG